ncbi:hypothetical protein C8R44DRAFT_763704 [Mycena epipterygia]|nr:hypothetical protein C8R44DRAFT_763704 [Mycena epipterygia]
MSATTMTVSYVKYAVGVEENNLEADKSTLIRDDQAAAVNQVSNALLLRTVIDSTGRLIVKEFKGALSYANARIGLHPNQAIDVLDMGPQVFTSEDHEASIRFACVIRQKPYTEAYAQLLSALQLDYTTVNGVQKSIPHIPRALWQKTLNEDPWISSYIDSVGDISRNLIHGNTISSAIWTLEDLDIALHTSNFSALAQAGLRSYMEEQTFTEKFLRRCVSLNVHFLDGIQP